MQLYVSYLVQDGSRVLTFCTLTKFKKLHQRGFVWQVVILKIFCMCKNLKNKKKFGQGSHQKNVWAMGGRVSKFWPVNLQKCIRVKKTDVFWMVKFLTPKSSQNCCEIWGRGRGGLGFFLIALTKCGGFFSFFGSFFTKLHLTNF